MMNDREKEIRDRIAKQLLGQVDFSGTIDDIIKSGLKEVAKFARLYYSAMADAGFAKSEALSMTISLQGQLLTELRILTLEIYRSKHEGST